MFIKLLNIMDKIRTDSSAEYHAERRWSKVQGAHNRAKGNHLSEY